MKIVLFMLLLIIGCSNFTHSSTNAQPTLVNGRLTCAKDHYFNGVKCILKSRTVSPYKIK